jgi:uncharacterized protein (TIGR01370 family)
VRSIRFGVAAALASCALLAGCGPAHTEALAPVAQSVAPLPSRPLDTLTAPPKSFAFAIGDGMLAGSDTDVANRLGRFNLVVVDGEEVTASQVTALHARGTRVLAYLSAGTIEKGRSWYPAVRAYRLEHWGEWDEWYADVSKPAFRNVLVATVAPQMLGKGVDGLFLDNTDMISDHPAQRAGMVSLIQGLSTLVHARAGRLLFAQNGDDVVDLWAGQLDGWNREDLTSTYAGGHYEAVASTDTTDAVATIRRLRARGLIVTSTDYVASGDAGATARALQTACAAGALPWVADIELTRLPPAPFTCPS